MKISEKLARIEKDHLLIISNPSLFCEQDFQEIANAEGNDLTLIIYPSNAEAQRIINSIKSQDLLSEIEILGANIYPSQGRNIIASIAAGKAKLLFLSPESFVHWFSGVIEGNTVYYRGELSEESLRKKVNDDIALLLNRIRRAIAFGANTAYSGNDLYKQKYFETLQELKRLPVQTVMISDSWSNEFMNFVRNLYPFVQVSFSKLALPEISLSVNYVFSKDKKKSQLTRVLSKNTDKPTIVYVQPYLKKRLSEIAQQVRTKIPSLSIKVFDENMLPEQKAETFDYFCNDPCPNIIISGDLNNVFIDAKRAKRLVHYSAPISLSDYYNQISSLAPSLEEAVLIVCEDDFVGLERKEYESKDDLMNKREGIKQDFNKQKSLLLEWVSSNICRWIQFEKLMIGKNQLEENCGCCDVCTKKKHSSWATWSFFWLKKKFKAHKKAVNQSA